LHQELFCKTKIVPTISQGKQNVSLITQWVFLKVC